MMTLEEEASEAAVRGRDVLRTFFRRLTKAQYAALKPMLPELEQLVKATEEAKAQDADMPEFLRNEPAADGGDAGQAQAA